MLLGVDQLLEVDQVLDRSELNAEDAEYSLSGAGMQPVGARSTAVFLVPIPT